MLISGRNKKRRGLNPFNEHLYKNVSDNQNRNACHTYIAQDMFQMYFNFFQCVIIKRKSITIY